MNGLAFHRCRSASSIATVALVLACALAASGCGTLSKAKRLVGIGPPGPALRSLKVSADPGANLGNATRLDVVVAFSTKADAGLPKTGPEWFQKRDALLAEFPKDLVVVSLEVPTPSPEFEAELPSGTRSRAMTVHAFADYAAKQGWPALTLTPFKRPVLTLGATSIVVEEEKKQ